MVIMDLIQLTAQHAKVICENDIGIDSIIQIVTHAAYITGYRAWDDFINRYEENIRSRDISKDEKERLIAKLHAAWGNGKPESPRGTNQYGVKQIILDDNSIVEQTADEIAEYFGLLRA